MRRNFKHDDGAIRLAVDRIVQFQASRQKAYIILPAGAAEACVVERLDELLVGLGFVAYRSIAVFAVGSATQEKCRNSRTLWHLVALDEESAATAAYDMEVHARRSEESARSAADKAREDFENYGVKQLKQLNDAYLLLH